MNRFVEALESRSLMSVSIPPFVVGPEATSAIMHKAKATKAPIPNLVATYKGSDSQPFTMTITSQTSKGKISGTFFGLAVAAVPGSATATTPLTGTINNKGQFKATTKGSIGLGKVKVTFTYTLTGTTTDSGAHITGNIKITGKVYGHSVTARVPIPFTATKQ